MKKTSKIALVLTAFAIASIFLPACSTNPESSQSATSAKNPTHQSARSATPRATYTQISQDEAKRLMETEKDYVILDVRTHGEFAEKHLPNAICVPVEDISDTPPSELPDKDQLVLVYCRSGNRSKTASQKLVDMGYTNVVEFGGINTWDGDVVSD